MRRMKTKFAICVMILALSAQELPSQTTLGGLNTQLQGTQITGQPGGAATPVATASTAAEGDCTIRNSSFVVLRAEPKLESAQVATLDATDRFTVLERSNGWAKVRGKKGSGWLRTHYLNDPKAPAETATAGGTAPGGAVPSAISASTGSSAGAGVAAGTKKKNIYSGPVFMRAGKTADAASPGIIQPGGDVMVLAVEGDWLLVESGGARGYVRSAYVGDQPPPRTATGRIQEPLRHPGDPAVPRPGVQPQPGGQPAANPNPPAATQGDGGSGRFGGKMVNGGRVTSEFGNRFIFGKWSHHNGIDIGVPTGTPCMAVGDGKVTKIGYDVGGGKYIDIKYDNGYSSRYYHLKSTSVAQGARVSQGQVVCQTDNTGAYTTGAHLHAEFKNAQGKFVNPRSIPGLNF